MKNIILVFIIGLFSLTVSAQKARVKGVLLDEFNNPVENVTVTVGDKGTVSNENGFYLLELEANTKVTITCKFHGDFEQTPKDHLQGSGCMACRLQKGSNVKDKNHFISKANEIHNKKYSYSKTDYKKAIDSLKV